jgi:GNAT superfamily N-acetyltransferase
VATIAMPAAANAVHRFSGPAEVNRTEMLDAIAVLRAEVWQASGGVAAAAFPEGRWHDDCDLNATHWTIRDENNRLVAAARLTVHPTLADVPEAEEYARYGLDLEGPIAAPARVVVCPGAQGRGLGQRLLDAQDQTARRLGARHAVRQASPAMVRLLVHRGWRIIGPARTDPRFPEVQFQVAVLTLGTTP